jgi:hypothetical protein
LAATVIAEKEAVPRAAAEAAAMAHILMVQTERRFLKERNPGKLPEAEVAARVATVLILPAGEQTAG